MKRPQQVLCVRGLLFCKDNNVLSIDFHEWFDNLSFNMKGHLYIEWTILFTVITYYLSFIKSLELYSENEYTQI